MRKAVATLVAVMLAAGAVSATAQVAAPEVSVECRVVAAETAYRHAQWEATDAFTEWRTTGFRRHKTAHTDAVKALERAATERWNAWQAWREADGADAAVAHHRYRQLVKDGRCDG